MNTCAYWNCTEQIRTDHVTCRQHYGDLADRKLDQCPSCGQLKQRWFETCLTCKDGKQVGRPKGFMSAVASVLGELLNIDEKPTPRAKRSARSRRASNETARKKDTATPAAQKPVARWKDADTDNFYIYVMELDGGQEYYVGQTNDIRARKREHQQGRTKTTANRDPQLVWFTRVRTRQEALDYETHLRKLARAENGRAITRMVIEFEDLVRELKSTGPQ